MHSKQYDYVRCSANYSRRFHAGWMWLSTRPVYICSYQPETKALNSLPEQNFTSKERLPFHGKNIKYIWDGQHKYEIAQQKEFIICDTVLRFCPSSKYYNCRINLSNAPTLFCCYAINDCVYHFKLLFLVSLVLIDMREHIKLFDCFTSVPKKVKGAILEDRGSYLYVKLCYGRNGYFWITAVNQYKKS